MPIHALHRLQLLGVPILAGHARLRHLHVRSAGPQQLHQLLHFGNIAHTPLAHSVLFQAAQKHPLPRLLHCHQVCAIHGSAHC